MPYLAKDQRPDINNGPGVTRIVPTFWRQHLFKFSSNSTGHSSLWSDGRYTCSSLPFMVWWIPYLNKGCRPDFRNGLEGDSDSSPVFPPGVYLSPTRIMAHPRATPILCQMKYTTVSGLLLMFSWWLPYLAKGPTPDFNSDPGNDSNIGCILALQRLFESKLNNSPPPPKPFQSCVRYTSVHVSYLWFPGGCHI